MQLLTEEIKNKLFALYSQENEKDPMVYMLTCQHVDVYSHDVKAVSIDIPAGKLDQDVLAYAYCLVASRSR